MVAYYRMADIFMALGDETRRTLLDRLRHAGALSLTELAAPLPMTRQAVTKHLDVLEGAGLVERTTRGRERLHCLRAEPLREIGTWLEPYERFWDDRLARLEQHLRSPPDDCPARQEEREDGHSPRQEWRPDSPRTTESISGPGPAEPTQSGGSDA